MLYANYIGDEAVYEIPEVPGENPGVLTFTGTIPAGTTSLASYLTMEEEVSLVKPTMVADTKEASWNYESPGGTDTTYISLEGCVNGSKEPDGYVYDGRTQLALYAAKGAYGLTVAGTYDGGFTVTAGNTALTKNGILPVKPEETVTITLDNKEAFAHTVVWYEDVAGVPINVLSLEGAVLDEEDRTITFPMPALDTQVFITEELTLDLSDYPIAFTKEGFRVEWEVTRTTSDFAYGGDLLIQQSDITQMAVTNWVGKSQTPVTANGSTTACVTQNYFRFESNADTLTRTITLERILQQGEEGNVGNQVAEGVDARLIIRGIVQLVHVQVPETASIEIKGETDRNTDVLFIYQIANKDTSWIGNRTGKAGDITLQKLRILATAYGTLAYSGSTGGGTFIMKDCRMVNQNFHYRFRLAYNMSTVQILGCELEFEMSSSYGGYPFLNCGMVEFKNSRIDYTEGSKEKNCSGGFFAGMSSIVVEASAIMLHEKNSDAAMYYTRKLYSSLTPSVILKSGAQLTSDYRLTLRGITVEEGASLTVGDSTNPGYLFCSDVQVEGGSVEADHIILSGFYTGEGIDKSAVLAALTAGTDMVTVGILTMTGGSVTADTFLGGQGDTTITVEGGNLTAGSVGTSDKRYGYGQYIPKVGEEYVYSLAKTPTKGAVVNISGGTVSVSEHLGGQLSQVTISGGEVTGEAISTPYGTATISGADAAVSVANLTAENGVVTIENTKEQYENPYTGTDKNHARVGVLVSDTLEARNLSVKDGAVVYANEAYVQVTAGNSGVLEVTGDGGESAHLYTGEDYGSQGEGSAEILVAEDGSRLYGTRQYAIHYVLGGNEEDPAVNAVENPSHYTAGGEDIILSNPSRSGYDFAGWYENSSYTGESLTKLTTAAAADITIYAKWVPKLVTFSVSVDTSLVPNLTEEVAGIPGSWNEDHTVFTFERQVQVAYLDQLYGTEEGHIDLSDYYLDSYGITELSVDETDYAGDIVLPVNGTVTKELLNTFLAKEEENPVVSLKATLIAKARVRLTLDLNLDKKNRPLDSSFLTVTEPETRTTTTISSFAEISSTIVTAPGFADTEGNLVKAEAPGYTFVGWYTNSECTGEPVTKDYVLERSSATYLYAKWMPNVYRITFEAGAEGIITSNDSQPEEHIGVQTLSGEGTYDTVLHGNLTYESQAEQGLPYAWKQGHVFAGWTYEAAATYDATGSYDITEDTPILSVTDELNLSTVPAEFFDVDAAEDTVALTLYALYRPVEITYVTNGGQWKNGYTGETITVNATAYGAPLAGYTLEGDACSIISTTAEAYATNGAYDINDYRHAVVRKGYTFLGWFDREQEVQKVPAYEDVTVTAKWQANTYTLELYALDESKEADYYDTDFVYGYTNQVPTATVVVGEEIGSGINGVEISSWPSRGDANPWYAYNQGDAQSAKRYLLGFTFDSLNPGHTEDGHAGYEAYVKYQGYVNLLTNRDSLFVREEEGSAGTTAGSIFRLPEDAEYGDLSNTQVVPDYPDGSTIPMYGTYREYSLVFVEYLIDVDGNIQETVLASYPYSSWQDYPYSENEGYGATGHEAAWNAKGYSLTGWRVNGRGTSYAEYAATEADYNEVFADYQAEAQALGTYDILVYTAYAPQVSVENVSLMTRTDPTTDQQSSYTYTLPGSLQEGSLTYTISDLTGLTLVEGENWNKYDHGTNAGGERIADTTVAVKAVLSSAAGVVKGSTWLTQSDGSTTDLFGEEVTAEAGDRITLTLYHSSIISRTENIFFDLKLGYEEEVLSEQYITFEDLQIGMRPSIYEVTYQVEVPVEQELVVSDWKEFHETNHTRILGVNYGSPVLAGIPDIEGYTANGQWKYSDTELDYGEGLFLPVTAADNGRITLESEWNINDYVLWGANELLEHWEIAYDGTVLTGGSILGSGAKVTIPYHTTVTFTPKTGEDYPEFVWLTLKETVEDALEETTLWLDHYKEAEEQEGVYTFRMPAADVDAAYQNVMDLYLEKGSITINETGYLQETAGQEGENQSEPVTWRGDYVILMDAENNTDNSSTDNTLRLTGDLSGRGIALGNLFITGEDSIALEADTNAELVTLYEAAGSAIEAKNILVPETAALIMRGSGTLNLAPENGAAAIGGRNGEQSKNGTITLEALEIHMNLRPSRASGIGAGDQTKGGGAVLLTDCTVTVTETPTASDVYHGAWIGGYQVTSVTLQNTTVNRTEASIEMIGPKVLDGQTVSLNESSIGTQALPVTDPIHAETRLVITDSNIYQKLQMDDSIALCVEDGGTAGVIEVTNSTIESIVRDPKALYTGTLKLLDVNSDVVLANTQMLEATHGDITIDAEQVKQGVTTHAHSGSYLLLHELEGSAAPAVTVNTVTDIQRLTIQDAGIGALHVNGDVTLQPEGEAESGLVTIKSGVLLSVEAGEEDTLRLNEGFDTTTSGSFRQTGGILEGGTDLAVGGNLTLSEVTVTAEIGSIGSHGVGGVTKVILNGGSVTAQTVGALGAQHETFTFVELLNEPETEGTLVQDLYRLTYVLENEDYPKNSEGVPYDAAYADTEISLPTVLRSTTLTDGTESVSPLIPGEPKYTGGGSTYFGNWYLSDPEENLYVLSTQEVPGFENRLAGLRAEQIEWTEEAEEDGTRTLTLYAWMQVQGSGVIEEGRQLNEVTGSATTVTKTADGAWTARFTVESPALPNSSYAFEVTEPFPAGTKLTLGLMHEEVPKFYWYLCTGEETAIPMEAFVRMGAAAGNSPSLEQGEPGSIWTHELQLSADVSEAEHVELTDTEVFVKLQFLQEGSAVDVAEVSYTIEAAPVASLTAEEEGVTVSFGGDSRLSGKTLYLTGEFLPTDEKNRIPYDATVELGEAVGRRISESTWAFELQDAEEAMGAVQYKQELFGFTAGTYEVTWKLTAAYPDNVNVLGHILTEDTVLVTVAESPEPEMEVSLQSIDGQETTSRTLGAGSTHRAKFAIETNQSNVTVTAEKQTALASFAATEKVTGIMEGSTATVTFPADLEGGVYRIRFSFAEGSEQDDVYYTFIVENVQ